MKKLIYVSLIVFLVAGIFASSCKKLGYGELGETISLEQNLLGTWKLDSVIQTDKIALDKAFPAFVQRLNITSLFPYNTLGVTFTDGGTGKAGTFSFTNPGNAPIFVASTGNWSSFDQGGPIRIKLAGTNRTDSIDFGKAYRVSDKKLSLRYNRAFYTGDKKTFVYYDFNFSRN